MFSGASFLLFPSESSDDALSLRLEVSDVHELLGIDSSDELDAAPDVEDCRLCDRGGKPIVVAPLLSRFRYSWGRTELWFDGLAFVS